MAHVPSGFDSWKGCTGQDRETEVEMEGSYTGRPSLRCDDVCAKGGKLVVGVAREFCALKRGEGDAGKGR